MTLSLPISYSSLHYSSNHPDFLSLHFPVSRRPRWPRMNSAASGITAYLHRHHHHRRKDKIVVIMGATGSGKSRLSVDLATRFPSEIINCDKMQVYKGLDITTNKISFAERRGVPHHLLGEFDPLDGEVTAAGFRTHADAVISDIVSMKKLPFIVGGSNSFIHALVVDEFDQDSNVFDGFDPITSEFRYRCCFLWVDVLFPILTRYLSKRVDDMLDLGMLNELAEFYDPEKAELMPRTGLRKAIGVPEFDRYFKGYHPKGRECRRRMETGKTSLEEDRLRKEAYEEAVRAIKEKTCQLTERQLGKIARLKGAGWDLKKVDATEAFRAVLTAEPAEKWSEIWDRQVVQPSIKIVKSFFEE